MVALQCPSMDVKLPSLDRHTHPLRMGKAFNKRKEILFSWNLLNGPPFGTEGECERKEPVILGLPDWPGLGGLGITWWEVQQVTRCDYWFLPPWTIYSHTRSLKVTFTLMTASSSKTLVILISLRMLLIQILCSFPFLPSVVTLPKP